MLEKISHSSNRFFTPNRVSFSVCLGVAMAGWFLTKMSKFYTHQLTYDLAYVVPQDATFAQEPPMKLDVDVRATGWSLLRLVRGKSHIEVMAPELAGKATSTKIFLSEKLGQMAGDELSLVTANPDQILFNLVKKESKLVPVELKGELILHPQFQWRDPLKIEPDSVKVFGSPQQLSEISSWSTTAFFKEGINKDFKEKIKLEPSGLSIETDSSYIWLSGFVDQITEKEIYVPIQVVDSLKGKISVFPDQALVRVNLGLTNYDLLEASDFLLVAELDSKDASSLQVKVKKYPDYVTYLGHTPESVDFIRSNP